MKPKLRYILVVWLLSSCVLSAQQLPWSVQLGAGTGYYVGDLSSPSPQLPHLTNIAQHLSISRRLSPSWTVGLRFDQSKLSANDQDYEDDYRQIRAFRFETDYWSLSLPVSYYTAGNKDVSAYFSFGPGLLNYSPEFDYSFSRATDVAEFFREDDLLGQKESRFQLFMGLGSSWRVSDKISIDLGLTLAHAFTDYLDGVSLSASPDDKDWYGTADLSLSYHFGHRDQDKDGIADQEDRCPNIPGLASLKGCPDSDRDGLADWEDNCPLEAGLLIFMGCPDSDGDGTPDFRDLCPEVVGNPGRNGCPSPQIDTDNDGITDPYDLCPNQAGPSDRGGCPAIDSDRDGLLDEDDHCPQIFGLTVFYGCPDSDGDGIADDRDACPTLFGVYADGGCPTVASEKELAEQLSTQYVPFLPNRSDLTRIPLLEKLKNFLLEHPTYHLRLRGYADSNGDEAHSPNLSTRRALIIRDFLIENGIPLERITSEGVGARTTGNTELTQAEREKNRRVTFELRKT